MTTNNVMTMTKLKHMAAMAELAAGVLSDHPAAPQVAYISLGENFPHGLRVDLRLTYTEDPALIVRAVALWAQELGTDVTLVTKSAHVEITVVTTIGHYPMRVWNHLTPDQARHLLTATGTDYDERGRAVITPGLVLSVDWT